MSGYDVLIHAVTIVPLELNKNFPIREKYRYFNRFIFVLHLTRHIPACHVLSSAKHFLMG